MKKLLGICLWFCVVLPLAAQVDSVHIENIQVVGNKRTKTHIILREVQFEKGGKYSREQFDELVEQTENNLTNLALFNLISIVEVELDNQEYNIIIRVIERWYIIPFPIFEHAETNFNTWWLTRDFSRTNYGLFVEHLNFRGRKEYLYLKAKFGYTQQFALKYQLPYIDKKQKLGAGIWTSYYQNVEIVYGTENNKRDFYNTPTGSVRDDFEVKGQLRYRNKIHSLHHMEVTYRHSKVDNEVLDLNPNYFMTSGNELQFTGIHYNFIHEKRDNFAYPLKGYYLKAGINKVGLGMLPNEPDILVNRLEYQHHLPIMKNFYASAGFRTKYTFYQELPYYLQRGFGWENYVRGYEYYVIDGQHFALFKTNLRYRLIESNNKPKEGRAPRRFDGFHYAFYLSAFADAGYVHDELWQDNNPISNTWMSSVGFGIDFVTMYDKVFRFEYSFNRLGENGFFLHLNQAF